MADFYGDEQKRVLDVKDRSLDNVVFLYKRPPLSSEWNLINQISNEKIQDLAKVSLPSGWLYPEEIFQDMIESDARTGNVLCSESYAANSFKLASIGNNIAIVNGWPILVQGTESSDNNNVITLSNPTGHAYDFVFLEVWRKLINADDSLYPYGNVTKNPYSDNEIVWDVAGYESSKRIQIQYRIRSVNISTAITDTTKEIFDLTDIYPIGGRTNGEALLQKYYKAGASDPGLYIAGDGSQAYKEYLNTVDGFVYAIPMFIVYRRALSENPYIATKINTTSVKKYIDESNPREYDGCRSDRPDAKYADVIYSEDIVDQRHRVAISEDLKSIAELTISKLMSGDLSTVLKKGFGENGAITNASSGGNTLLKLERINSIGGDNIPNIGYGSDTSGNTFKRRAFCNAEIWHNHNIVEITRDTATWEETSFPIESKVILPEGDIISIDGFYSPDQGLVSGVSSDGFYITIINGGGSSIVGTSNRLYMEFTFKYSSSSSGFKDIPKEFIEVNKDDSIVIATKDNDIPLRYNNKYYPEVPELLNFSAGSGEYGYVGDINASDYVSCKGGVYTELTNFGHELVLYRSATNGFINISLSNYKYNEYDIIGVKSIEYSSELLDFEATRESSNLILEIPALLSESSASVIVTLYTGSISDTFKFFDLSKQGKGIIDTYEMIEVTAVRVGGLYVIDTGDKPIIKIATKAITTLGNTAGMPYVFNSIGELVTIDDTINNILPVLNSDSYDENYLPTIIKIEVPGETNPIKVPVLVHSYISSTESPYNFYYKTKPYQGMLNTTLDSIYGKVLSECSALITTSGSGAIIDYTYSRGTATFITGSRTISGSDTQWSSFILPGDFIRVSQQPYFYRIAEVTSDTEITLFEQFKEDIMEDAFYDIVRFDIPDSIISNIIDRLPALSISSTNDITDYSCYSDSLSLSELDNDNTIITKAFRKFQDPINSIPNDFMLGSSSTAKRGRNDFRLTLGGNKLYRVGNGRPYISYNETAALTVGHNKKAYQFYLFVRSGKGYLDNDPDLMGKVYLLAISSETIEEELNLLNPFFDKDTVDIFELIGRPIIKV